MKSASEFFSQQPEAGWGPRFEALREVGGVVKFDVEGEEGGVWYLDLASGEISQTEQTPTVIVRGLWGDLWAFVSGRMSAEDGVLTERLSLAGDVVDINRLAAALADPEDRN